MEEVRKFIIEYQREAMLMFGVIGYLLSKGKMPLRFFFFLVWSSLFVGLLLLPAIFEYMQIPQSSAIAKALTTFSPLVAIEIVSLLTTLSSSVTKAKIHQWVGVEEEK